MIPDIALPLFELFKQSGEELYLVGGSVRDYQIHKFRNDPLVNPNPSSEAYSPHDLDFATSAYPDRIQEILKAANWPCYPLGALFGTIGTRIGDMECEITTYRCEESYTHGSRHPVVTFGDSLLKDLERRDFTINAMAMDADGTLIDPYCGMGAYIEGLLLTPSEDPESIFKDDPLRMLRGCRFTSQLGVSLCGMEAKAIEKLKAEIHHISAERIFQEMSKLLMTPKPSYALKHMAITGLLGEIFPDLQTVVDFKQNQGKWHSKLVWPHTLDVVDQSPAILEVRWAALFHDVSKPDTYSETDTGVHFYGHENRGSYVWNDIADGLKVSTEFKRDVHFLIAQHLRISQLCSVPANMISRAALRRFIRQVGPALENLFHLSLADITSHHPNVVKDKRAKCFALKATIDDLVKQCDVRELRLPKGLGKDVAAALSLPHGPQLGHIMRMLNDALVSGYFDGKEFGLDSDFIAAAKVIKRREEGLRELSRIGQTSEKDSATQQLDPGRH